jgi:hypothetical protein
MFTVGVFQDVMWAERGIAALLADGFPRDTLSVVAKSSPETVALIQSMLGEPPTDIDAKDLGVVSAHGPLVEALGGPRLGSTGLAAVFGRAGFQRHDGHIFQTLVGRGGVLVAVSTEPRAADALALLHAYGGGNAAIGAWTGRV